MTEHPLAGLNVVITRPREQAVELAEQIKHLGAHPLLFPLLEISEVPDSPALTQQLARVASAQLLIFISPNAVKYGLPRIAPRVLLSQLNIATVGQGTAKALREAGIARVIAPSEQFDSEGLLALPELQNVVGSRVIIFRGDGGRELLGETLRARGAVVEYVACYQRSKAKLDMTTLLPLNPHVFSVTSSEALSHLSQLLDEGQFPAIKGTPLFVPHERIAEMAKQKGWQDIHQTASGDDGLVSGLVAWAHSRHSASQL